MENTNFDNETMEQYLARIGGLNNKPKTETFTRFDNDNEWN
jgi:hypothetical protein